MRRRLDIAMSIIASPPVIFLDEPTAGLDPQGRVEVWRAVEGRGCLRLPAHLPAVPQLGDRANRDHARPGGGLRQSPAGDAHRQYDPRPVRPTAGRHRSAPTSGPPSPGASVSSSWRTPLLMASYRRKIA
ncbi:hypothetical protein [Streptomyces lasiicapitis]|uniref:hypothetical protein n=1 Tax=Streptomyces lasiicapitis TaxID=1923961 RepID=UPI003D9EC490